MPHPMRRFKNNYKKNRNLQAQRRGGDGKPPQPAVVIRTGPAEEPLWERPELEAFGVEWVRAWVPYVREAGGGCQGYTQVHVDG